MVEATMLIAVIVGISQIIKNIGLPSKFVPLVNLGLGVGLSLLYFTNLSIQENVIQGLMIGLSASGLYDQTKKVSVPTKSKKTNNEPL